MYLIVKALLEIHALYRFGDGIFVGSCCVLVYGFCIFLCMSQTAGTANASAFAGHTFNKVSIEYSFVGFQQSSAAGFNTVTGYRFVFKIICAMFFQTLSNCFCQTAAAGKNAAEAGSIIERDVFKGLCYDIAAVE